MANKEKGMLRNFQYLKTMVYALHKTSTLKRSQRNKIPRRIRHKLYHKYVIVGFEKYGKALLIEYNTRNK